MSIEGLLIGGATVVAAFLIASGKLKTTRNVAFFALFIFVALMRLNGLDQDFNRYYLIMQVGPENEISYWRTEFVFWKGIQFLYGVLHDSLLVVLVIDAIWIYALTFSIFSIFSERDGATALSILVLSFCFFFLYQNIYRQLLSTVFFITAYSIRKKSWIKSDLIFVFALLNHNAIVVFYPILLAVKFFHFGQNIRNIVFYGTTIIGLTAIIYVKHNHGAGRTGMESFADMSWAYIFVVTMITMYFLIIARFQIKDLICYSPTAAAGLLILLLLQTQGFESSIIERLGMTLICCLIIDLLKYPPTWYISVKHFQVLLLIGLAMPIFLSPNSRFFFNSDSRLKSSLASHESNLITTNSAQAPVFPSRKKNENTDQ